MKRIAILHGAGYTGGELIRLACAHPRYELAEVTSRSFVGQAVSAAHPLLKGMIDLRFTDQREIDYTAIDGVFVAAEHGQGAAAVLSMLRADYQGVIVDLSADFRFDNPGIYPRWFGFEHPAPALLADFAYGLPEVKAPYPEGTMMVANPGCFATAIALALWPLSRLDWPLSASVTALTGASGSGVRPKDTTHFPTREGNVRAYKVFRHQHQPEIEAILGPGTCLEFVPVSGPWTRGIWGTAHISLPEHADVSALTVAFEDAYASCPFVRLWPDELPELRYSVGTPFVDVGWKVDGRRAVVGFALDNLLKGAASQAIQNMNLLLGLPETAGLLPPDRVPAAFEVQD